MFRRSPSRNPRSKSIRAKHILQICLLLGVCFWLIYQVKHSHDKKKEYNEKDAKLSVKTQSGGELLKFGRKDLPHSEQVTMKQEHHEEEEKEGGEEEENKPDEEREEEENKHEVEEHEEEENKSEDTEDEERGGGDNEIDENDEEKLDGEGDRDEEFLEEEKEREEEGDEKDSERNWSVNKEGQVENENSSEDQDHDGGDQNSHEAREEHYKGDDASSAVTHDTQTIISETEKVSSEDSNENLEMNTLEQENKSNNTEEINSDQNNSVAKNSISLNVIDVEDKGNDGSSNSVDRSVTNSTMTTQSNDNDHPEAINNTTLVSTNAGNYSTEVSTEGHDTTGTGSGTSDSSQQNVTVPLTDSAHDHNLTVAVTTTGDSLSVQTLEMEKTNNSTTDSESNQSDVNSTLPIKIENVDAAAGESSTPVNNSKFDVSEKITSEAEDGSGSLTSKENADAEKDKSAGNTESGGTKESADNSSRHGTFDSVQHDPIDASDSHISLNEKEVRTDLDTLPEIRTEGDNSEDTAAE